MMTTTMTTPAVPQVADQGDEVAEAAASYEMGGALAAAWVEHAEPMGVVGMAQPSTLLLSAITLHPTLFQPRPRDARHLADLRAGLDRDGRLDPVEVWACGPKVYLIDGHHRAETYRRAKWQGPVPVRWFTGSPDEAMLRAREANSRAKLAMSPADKANAAWQLVKLAASLDVGHRPSADQGVQSLACANAQVSGGRGRRHPFSRAGIATSAGVSTGLVATMRRAVKEMGAEAFDYDDWWQARNTWTRGKTFTDFNEDEHAAMMKERADRIADRLHKTFGPTLTKNPELLAMALETCFGEKVFELVRHLPRLEDQEEDEETPF